MRLLKIILPSLGLLFLGYLIGHLGPEVILRNFGLMKWSFPAVLGLAFSWHVTNSIAWSFAFPAGAFRPKLRTLFMAKLAGEAVNQLTPLANIGGEPLKAYLLKDQSPASLGLASVVVNKMAQIITGLLFALVGLSLITLYWDLPKAIPFSIQAGMITLATIGVLLIWSLYRKQNRLFSSIINTVHKLGIPTELLEKRMAKAVRIDDNIGKFYRDHAGRFLLVMLFHSMGWLLGACETFVILQALGADIQFSVAFLITSLTVIINSLFFFMPSNIGVLEGGQVFLVATLGLPAALGLSLGIVKRMRKIFWISIGWLFLTHLSRSALQQDSPVSDSMVPLPSESEDLIKNRLNYR